MAVTLVLHLQNEEPVVGEVDEMPSAQDTLIALSTPRRLDGKDVAYLGENVVRVLWPLTRISFIEILPSKEEEEIIGFVRE